MARFYLSPTPSNTPSNTPAITPSNTECPITKTPTRTPTKTPTQTPTMTVTATNTQTPTFTPTPTNTQTPTVTTTSTYTPTPTNTETSTQTPTPTNTQTNTQTPTITPTTTETPTPTMTNTPTFVYYSGVFCTGNTQYDACSCTGSTTLYSSQPFYTPSQQVYVNTVFTPSNWAPIGLFMASGGTSYEYQFSGFLPELIDIGACPTMTPTPTATNTQTPTQTETQTPTPTNTETPTQTPTLTSTPTNTPTQTVMSFIAYTGTSSCTACDLSSGPITMYMLISSGPCVGAGDYVYLDSALTIPVPDNTYFHMLNNCGNTTGVFIVNNGGAFNPGQITNSNPTACNSCVTPTPTPTMTNTPTLTQTPTPTEPGGFKLLAEDGANIQTEGADDINIEH